MEESIKIFIEEETPDVEELKGDIAALSRQLADLKAKLYIAEHKGEKSAKMKRLLKKEAAQKKELEKWIIEEVTPTLKTALQIIPLEDFLRMIKEIEKEPCPPSATK